MSRIVISASLALALAAGAVNTAEARSRATGHHPAAFKTERHTLPGEGRGDYMLADEASDRLFVTHTSVVHILDMTTLVPVATVSGFKKAHGVAVAAGKGFASDGDGNAIIVFDLATGATMKIIAGGQNPDNILYDAPSGMVFAFNGTSEDVSVIDPVTAEIVKTIPVGDKPEFARSDGAGQVYFNMEDGHSIGVIDTAKGELVNRMVLPDCEGPAALALDTANHRLFSSCGNGQMKVVNADTGAIIASLPVGEDPDGIVFDARSKRIIVAARDGGWTIINQLGADRYRIGQVYKIDEYAKTLALDSKTGRVFSSTADLVWPTQVPGKKLLPNAKPGTFRLMVVSAR